MKKQEGISVPAAGGSSLLVVFGVLCLVMLALLSLNTVLAEQRICQTSARMTEEWYAADLQAQVVFARLRAGEQVNGVVRTEGTFSYSVPISDRQTLLVEVKETDGCWEVLSWQTTAYPVEGDAALPVWQRVQKEGSYD